MSWHNPFFEEAFNPDIRRGGGEMKSEVAAWAIWLTEGDQQRKMAPRIKMEKRPDKALNNMDNRPCSF